MRIIVAGAGRIGEQLVANLTGRGGYEIAVVDTDEERCEELADRYDALVIHGDATNPEVLEEAQIDRADAVVATTGSDPINAVVAMLAHRQDVARIIVKIETNALRGALAEIGVSEVVAPTLAAAAKIHAALHGSEHSDLAQLAKGGLRLSEVEIHADLAGQHIGDLDLPEDVLPVAVLRAEHAVIARRGEELEEGDLLVVVAESDDAVEQVRDRLAP